ncbi:hypothetical protein [Peribacillus frigoritolerans]|nr:hypothetical protein [Peribacillus frigoritolerans]
MKTLNSQKETKNQSQDNTDDKELLSKLKKQASVAAWIKFIGAIMEAIISSEIFLIVEAESESKSASEPNERQVIQGLWIQTIGQFFDSVGITKQAITNDETKILEASEISNFGDWIQTVGGIVEAYAGKQAINKVKAEQEIGSFHPIKRYLISFLCISKLYKGGSKMNYILIEYGRTLQKNGEELIQASKNFSFTTDENSNLILDKLEQKVSLLKKITTTLESVSPPKVIEKEHLELIRVFKDLTEGNKYLI